jgi:hypothetical protein
MAMLYALPRGSGICVPLARVQVVPRLLYFREQSRRTRRALRRAPMGVLLIGALSNAGGLAYQV